MICPKCRGEWIAKEHDGRLYNICENCGYVDMRNGTVDGVPVGPTSPRLDSREHFIFEEQRKEIKHLRDKLGEMNKVLENLINNRGGKLEAIEEIKRLSKIEEAAINLIKVKGRYHSEQAYKQLEKVLGEK